MKYILGITIIKSVKDLLIKNCETLPRETKYLKEVENN